ncbi:GNAT family N-acetyltransferase [Rasiella rasia]|uniref:GNAT family N-acetyltransferase n=1 Tax=Rasiella rasia TaxID=2744027 RepID=A0A6G6GQ25_9FLAO|nr:GNAT family N-acetyltransferase [Rasiella rasia]QIE60686.1 GNAT family N-acetyltransferase [Rasiella rasia]
MKIQAATLSHLNKLTPLFNGYRVFYKQPSDIARAEKFLTERLEKGDSTIFIAISENEEAMGFTQLYPSFSSVSTQRTYILNDLYVSEAHRKKGVGEALMQHAKQFAILKGAKGITLETETHNPAQHLYERIGWKKDTAVFHYTWEIH